MSGELWYRVSFGGLWLIYFIVRLYYQRKVRGQREYVLTNERQEKLFFRLFALAYFLLPLYFLTPWIDFAGLTWPIWLRWGGGMITILGILLFAWSHQTLGMNWTAVLALSPEHTLTTTGPYRWIRHPMYTAFFVIGFGFLFLSANVFSGVIYLGTLLAMYGVRVSTEEKMMLARFGESYRIYMQRTGRLIPKLWK